MVGIIILSLGIAAILGVSWWGFCGIHYKCFPKTMFCIGLVLILIVSTVFGIIFSNTPIAQSWIKDSKSEFSGIERTIHVYTADGTLMAEYRGNIYIDDSNGGVSFVIDGKRYIYWNCFIESIEQ